MKMKSLRITVQGNTIAKKNSERIVKMGRRRAIRPSAAFDLWAEEVAWQLKNALRWTGDYPVDVCVFWYRKTRAKFDFDNMAGSIQDVLVRAEILEDDSMMHVYPVVLGWAVDKKNPRCEVEIREIFKADKGGDPCRL